MKSTFPFLMQCHRFYFYFLPTLLHILHFFLASSLNLHLLFPSLSQCLYLSSSYIITYSAFLSSSFMMKSPLSFFLLLHGIYIYFLLTPHTLHSTLSYTTKYEFLSSFLSFPLSFFQRNHRDYVYFYWMSSEND